MRVEQLFISPGHNFFGHHGQPAGEYPISQVEQLECVAGRGIRGDRFFDFKENYKGQITFFDMEVLEALRLELNLPEAQAQATPETSTLPSARAASPVTKRATSREGPIAMSTRQAGSLPAFAPLYLFRLPAIPISPP